jgi:nitrogenase subunit NifH
VTQTQGSNTSPDATPDQDVRERYAQLADDIRKKKENKTRKNIQKNNKN